MKLDKYHFAIGQHRQQPVIWVRFPKDNTLIQNLRAAFPMAKWSCSANCWFLPDETMFRERLGLPINSIGKNTVCEIHPSNHMALGQLVDQLKLKAYSPSTLSVYSSEFTQLLLHINDFPVNNLTADELKSYFLYCVKTLCLSENHLNSRINAIKFYFEKVLHRQRMFFDIPRPKRPQQLPKVLSKEEVIRLLRQPDNIKHKLMLKLCYGMGLRVSEITALKIEHIDSHRMQVLIQAAKGKKDRCANLPHSVLNELRAYYKEYRPGKYLFEGQFGGQYSIRSVQMVFKQAMKKAKIRKQVGIHGLRHSYATHLLELGTDITLIQKVLGHKDIKTTMVYTHIADSTVSAVASPLDKING